MKIVIWFPIIDCKYKDLGNFGEAIHGKNQLNGFDMYYWGLIVQLGGKHKKLAFNKKL